MDENVTGCCAFTDQELHSTRGEKRGTASWPGVSQPQFLIADCDQNNASRRNREHRDILGTTHAKGALITETGPTAGISARCESEQVPAWVPKRKEVLA